MKVYVRGINIWYKGNVVIKSIDKNVTFESGEDIKWHYENINLTPFQFYWLVGLRKVYIKIGTKAEDVRSHESGIEIEGEPVGFRFVEDAWTLMYWVNACAFENHTEYTVSVCERARILADNNKLFPKWPSSNVLR